jgi:hypothetical protein
MSLLDSSVTAALDASFRYVNRAILYLISSEQWIREPVRPAHEPDASNTLLPISSFMT